MSDSIVTAEENKEPSKHKTRDLYVQWSPDDRHWKVRLKGAARASLSTRDKQKAVERAKEMARKRGLRLWVFRKDGQVDHKITRQRKQVPTQHVRLVGMKWVVQKEGAQQPSALYNYKKDAIRQGKALAARQDSRLVVHREDGTVQANYDFSIQPHDELAPSG